MTRRTTIEPLESRLLLATAGSLDPSFNVTGKVTTDFGAGFNDAIYAMLVQGDDSLVAAGASGTGGAFGGNTDLAKQERDIRAVKEPCARSIVKVEDEQQRADCQDHLALEQQA